MPSVLDENGGADLIVIGGGLAGLMTATLVAGAGRKVIVLERSGRPGGRAITRVAGGIHFNLGPHALYCRGAASRLLTELGIRVTGGFPDARHGLLTEGSRTYILPRGMVTALASRLLSAREKATFLRLFATLPRLESRRFDRVPLEDWIEDVAGKGGLARFIRTLCRVSTYVGDARRLSAGAAIDQLKLALIGGVRYLDGGWQVIVDGLRARLWEQGAEFRTGCRAESVRGDDGGVTVELATGEVLRGRAAVLAVDPAGAARLLGGAALASPAEGGLPVRAACLDVALGRLPRPDRRVAFDLDRPLYLSDHSASARLAPPGVSVIHVMKYLGDGSEEPQAVERELEGFLESIQPGWRSEVISRRFLPGLVVAYALPRAVDGGLAGRPGAELKGRPNVFLAGDWVGPEGMLADASAASAREAARLVLASPAAVSARNGGGVCHATA